jgi:hypothetical protein
MGCTIGAIENIERGIECVGGMGCMFGAIGNFIVKDREVKSKTEMNC